MSMRMPAAWVSRRDEYDVDEDAGGVGIKTRRVRCR